MKSASQKVPNVIRPSKSESLLQEIVNSMFSAQQKRSAFSSFRSAASATPEMSSPALSPMRKKLSTSQNLDNSSPNTIDHVSVAPQ